jgi:5'-methylthioadenosine phosphorylase
MSKSIIGHAIKRIAVERACPCASALTYAVITDRSAISADARERLDLIIGKYL